MKACQFCAEEIQDAAIVCKHCGRDLVVAAPPTLVATKNVSFVTKAFMIAAGLIVLLVVLGSLTGTSPASVPALTDEHRLAVYTILSSQVLSRPNALVVEGTGFLVATYEVNAADVDEPMRRFAEKRLLAIREALLPFGFKDYRVNVNGPPPGTGLVRRYGSARFIDGGSVEWITP